MCEHNFSFLWGNYPRVQLLGHMIIVCWIFITNCQIVFQDGCIILQPHQQCVSVPVSLHPCQHLVVLLFFLFVILICSIVVSICIFLMANDVEHLFMCSFAAYISPSVKCLCIFCPFSNWIVCFFTEFFFFWALFLEITALLKYKSHIIKLTFLKSTLEWFLVY